MTLIKNFERFVNENLSQKFQIFEDLTIQGETAYPKGYIEPTAFDTWITTPGAAQFKAFANLMAGLSSTELANKENQAAIVFALLKRGQSTKKGFLGIGVVDNKDIAAKGLEQLKNGSIILSMTQGTVDYIPDPKASTQQGVSCMKTAGRASDSATILTDAKFNQSWSKAYNVCNFVSEWNTAAFANGQAQIVLSEPGRMREDGYMDLVSAPNKVDNTTLYLYSTKIKGTEVASKQVTNTEVGGEPASTGKYGAEFVAGSAEINSAVQAEVDKAADFVISKFPAGKVPDKFQLTSGASTEWGKPAVNYPQTSGSGAVANPTTDEKKNQDLAYRRGVAFANALNAKLKEKGHPGIDGYIVNWAIGRSGQQANPADRFIDLEVQKNAAAPVKQASVAVSTTGSKDAISGASKAQIFEFKLTMAAKNAPAAPAEGGAAPAAPAQQ
jgi:hypothetical protein